MIGKFIGTLEQWWPGRKVENWRIPKMPNPHPQTDPLTRLVAWGSAEPLVRAMILTSSRARPDGPVDDLSDYDVVLAVSDAEGFVRDDGWQSAYGEPMVRWGDQAELYGLATYFRSVVYTDHVKFDYTLLPTELLARISTESELLNELDAGYSGTAGQRPANIRMEAAILPGLYPRQADQRGVSGAGRGVLVGYDVCRQGPLAERSDLR
jgi:hypothetical protein